MKIVLLALLLIGDVQGVQQNDQDREKITNFKNTPITLSNPSVKLLIGQSFSFGDNVQCDIGGNMYFHATSTFDDIRILRLSQNGNQREFKLASEDQKNSFLMFRVSPDGILRILDRDPNHGNKLYVHQ